MVFMATILSQEGKGRILILTMISFFFEVFYCGKYFKEKTYLRTENDMLYTLSKINNLVLIMVDLKDKEWMSRNILILK
jgi:hypothetical protein